jgi:hypothetical protein
VTASGSVATITGGTQYTVVTLDVDARGVTSVLAAPTAVALDGAALPEAADIAVCAAPGCWRFDAATKHLEVRAFAAQGQTRAIAIQ